MTRPIPLLLLLASLASAAEIHIQHSLIRKMLAARVFTDDGRKYIKANRAAKCSFAYLESPEIGAADGQLRIRAKFTGRSGMDMFGRCISLGDSFNAVIFATPYYDRGILKLKDVRVDSEGADGFYIRRVKAALASGLPQQFTYPLYDEARRLLEEQQPGAEFSKRLTRFDVKAIRVTGDTVVLALDYVIEVR